MIRPQIVCHVPGDPITCDLDLGRYDGFSDDAVAFLEETIAQCESTAVEHHLAGRIVASQYWQSFVNLVLAKCNWNSESFLDWLSQRQDSSRRPERVLFVLSRICGLAIEFAEWTQVGYVGPEHLLAGLVQSGLERLPLEPRAAKFLESWKGFTEDAFVEGVDSSKRPRNVFARLQMAKSRPHDQSLMAELRCCYDKVLTTFLKSHVESDAKAENEIAKRADQAFEQAVLSFEGSNLPQFNTYLHEALTTRLSEQQK